MGVNKNERLRLSRETLKKQKMNYLVKEFDFLVDKKFFPGYDVIKPFYITVEYEFYYQTKEVRVINLKFSVKAFPAIRVTTELITQITEAARQNSEYVPKSVNRRNTKDIESYLVGKQISS